jgi:adenosylcobinamide-GDP ribazoletransferase
MGLAPVVGALLGGALAALLGVFRDVGAPGLVAAAVTVTAGALLTRGMHLDGLADTFDALGSYRRGDAALEVMKKSDIGPFGVAAIALALLIQVAAISGETKIILAWVTGRLAITVACSRGVPAARPEGLGALVAGTVPIPVAVTIAAVVVAAAAAATPGRPWLGPAAVVASLAAVLLLVQHAVRRLGGITGDVLGAAVEVATTVALVGLSLAG